jgi:hypothetical protein
LPNSKIHEIELLDEDEICTRDRFLEVILSVEFPGKLQILQRRSLLLKEFT